MNTRLLLVLSTALALNGCSTIEKILPFMGSDESDLVPFDESDRGAAPVGGTSISFSANADTSIGACGDAPGILDPLFKRLKKGGQLTLQGTQSPGGSCIENYVAAFDDDNQLFEFVSDSYCCSSAAPTDRALYAGIAKYAAESGNIDLYEAMLTKQIVPSAENAQTFAPLRGNTTAFVSTYARLAPAQREQLVKVMAAGGAPLKATQVSRQAISDMESERMQKYALDYNVAMARVAESEGDATAVENTIADAETVVATRAEDVGSTLRSDAEAEVAAATPTGATRVYDISEAEPKPTITRSTPRPTERQAAVFYERAGKTVSTTGTTRARVPVDTTRPTGVRIAGRATAEDLRSGPVAGANKEFKIPPLVRSGPRSRGDNFVVAKGRKAASRQSSVSWRRARLSGIDHSDARVRPATLRGDKVIFGSWLRNTCDVRFNRAGEPSVLSNCTSAKGWTNKSPRIVLSCGNVRGQRQCGGSYRTCSPEGKCETTRIALLK